MSVILETYNHERYVEQALDSVLAQGRGPLQEVYVLDDASTDATSAIVDRYAALHPDLIKVRRAPKNLCTMTMFRETINEASGDFIALIDGDDYWTERHKLSRQVEYLDDNPDCTMCCHNAIVVDQTGERIGVRFHPDLPPKLKAGWRDIAQANYVPGSTALIRSEAARGLPAVMDPHIWSDLALYLHAAERGDIGYIPEILGAYRLHSGGQFTGMAAEQRFRTATSFIADAKALVPVGRQRALDTGLCILWSNSLFDAINGREFSTVLRLLGGMAWQSLGRGHISLLPLSVFGLLRAGKHRLRRRSLSRRASELVM